MKRKAILFLRWLCVCLVGVGLSGRVEAQQEPLAPPLAALLKEGYRQIEQGDHTEAEISFRRVLGGNPQLASAHRGLGLALWGQGQLPSAERELRAAVELDSFLEPGNPSGLGAAVHFELARVRDQLGGQAAGEIRRLEYQRRAIEGYQEALGVDPGLIAARMRLANLLLETGKVSDAVREAEVVVRSRPTDVESRLLLALAYRQWGDRTRAEEELNEALRIEPDHSFALVRLGELLMERGELGGAIEKFRRATGTNPEFWEAHRALGYAYLKSNQPREAIQAFETALNIESGDWQSRYHLATLVGQGGQLVLAAEHLEHAITAKPDFWQAYEELGYVLLRQGKVEAAARRTESLLRLSPRAAEGHVVLALVSWRRREVENALVECALVLESRPDDLRALALQALALWEIGEKAQTRQTMTQIAALQPQLFDPSQFCERIICAARDIGPIRNLLRRYRYLIVPRPQ